MTDRYDDGVRDLRNAPVPDQWDEIMARANATPPIIDLAHGAHGPGNGHGHGNGWHGGRRWPFVLAAAASMAVVVGALALVTREDPDLSTGSPSETTGVESATSTSTSTTDTTPETTPTPSTTTPSTTTTSPPAASRYPGEVVDIDNYPVSACRGLPFALTDPPADLATTMEAADPQDARVPDIVHGSITGVFPGATSTRAVFMVVGWPGLQDDAGTNVEGPFPGVLAWTAPYGDGWLAEIAAPASPETYCPYTVIGLGLTEADMLQFLAGLTLPE
jgi:hypothetical protein